MFLALTAEEKSIGTAPGGDIPADALLEEIASISSVPVIQVARSAA